MAQLVLAIGTSHSPALASAADEYGIHIERDKGRQMLDLDGLPCSYDDLLSRAGPEIAREIAPEVIERRVAGCNAALARISDELASARLDALIVVGDDQGEQYFEDNMPAFLVYWGETIRNNPKILPDDAPAFWKKARAQFHELDRPRDYPVASKLGAHLIDHLVECEFDISHARVLRHEIGEGHAFGFVHRRLMGGMGDAVIPILPVVLNTYFPPNQPRPGRCLALGRAIREGVERFDSADRIGILASGGLSHFVVDEALDRLVLDACRTGDGAALGAIPVHKLNSGNSEIRNWIAVAGAAENLATKWQDYQPCYRSPAGTGTGMGFAVWG